MKVEREFELAPGVKITVVLIPAGEFMMGSAVSAAEVARLAGLGADKAKLFEDEHPQRRVAIREPFRMSKHEVTQAQWEAVTGSNPSKFKGAKNPVESVSWNDVQEFLKEANAGVKGRAFALPTEAQWEYACWADSQTPFHFGETISTDQANYNGNYPYDGGRKGVYRKRTMPVGSFPANAWGLHDMHGNVWEWCQSLYKPYPYRADDGREDLGADGDRVLRGGACYFLADHCRSAFRLDSAPDGWDTFTGGFRVARPFP